MSLRTIANSRLIDWEKLDNAPADISAELDLKEDKVAWKWLSENDYTDAEKSKLAALDSALYEKLSNKWVASWYASLDWDWTVPASQLPSYVDDVLEFDTLWDFPVTWETWKIYVAKDTNKTYRWSWSTYVEIVWSIWVWRWAYDNGTSYILDDRVSYLWSSYICISPTTGNLPTNVTYWDVLAEKWDTWDTGATWDTGEKWDTWDTWPAWTDWIMASVVWWTNITVDDTDPANPIVNTSATVNSTDAHLLDRANHTWTQIASTISDFSNAVWAETNLHWILSIEHIVELNTDIKKIDIQPTDYFIAWTKYSYAWWTAITPTIWAWDSSTWVWLDSAWLVYSTDTFTPTEKLTILPLARLQAVQWQSWPWSDLQTPVHLEYSIWMDWYVDSQWLQDTVWVLYANGWKFSENATSFQVDEEAWEFYNAQRKKINIAWTTAIEASEVYHISWAPTVQNRATLVVPKYYDNWTDIVARSTTWWASHTLLKGPKDDDLFFLIYSSAEYTSKAIAESQAWDFWIFQSQSISWLIPVAKFIVSWSSTNIDLVKNVFPCLMGCKEPVIGIATVQDVYDNSTSPEITTDSTRWALSVQRGSASDTDNVYEWKNWSWTTTFAVDWNWLITWDWGNLTNLPAAWTTAGQGVIYYPWNTIVTWDNYNLWTTPEWWAEVEIQQTANSTTSPVFMERYVSDPLWWTEISWGAWIVNTYASVDSDVWVSEIKHRMNKAVEMTWTVTSTWTWLTRTFTATEAWTFVSWDADPSILNATLIQTPTETFFIDTFISGTVVTATSDNAWYTNETWVAFSNFYKLFEWTTWEISWTDHTNYPSASVQQTFTINPADRLLIAYFAVASTSWDKVLSFYKNWQDHYSHIVSPLIYRHNDLEGLNEWTVYNHLTDAQLAVVNATSGANTWDQTDMSWISDTTANFNTSLSDDNFATINWTETLSNKTLTSPIVNSPTWIVTNDVTESTDKNYVTDAEKTNVWNLVSNWTWDNYLSDDWSYKAVSWWASESTQTSVTAWEDVSAGDAVAYLSIALSSNTPATASSWFWHSSANNEKLAQKFTISSSIDINKIDVWLWQNANATDNAVIRIETDNAWAPSWVLADINSTVSIWTSLVKKTLNYNTFTLSAWTYHLVCSRDWALDASNYYQIWILPTVWWITSSPFQELDSSSWVTNSTYWISLSLLAPAWYFKSDASDANKVNFTGIASETVTSWNPLLLDTAWVNSSQSGLTAWSEYYLADTAWEISTTPWTNSIKVGKALSATEIEIYTWGEIKISKSIVQANVTTWFTLTAASVLPIQYINKPIDINWDFSTSTYIFTVPRNWIYTISYWAWFYYNLVANSDYRIEINKNWSVINYTKIERNWSITATANSFYLSANYIGSFLAWDEIQVVYNANSTANWTSYIDDWHLSIIEL